MRPARTPGAASAPSSGSTTTAGKTFNLAPEQDRIKVDVDSEAAALVPEVIKADGKLTVVTTGGSAPLTLFATDNKTLIGSEVDIAYAVGETLGLEVEVLPVAWADWPLGVESGKYEAVLSNMTVTETRKEKFDFATYRNDLLGFSAKADSTIGQIKEAKDVAGKRVIVGSGTNEEAILVRWDEENKARGLEPVAFQYDDDDSASSLALQSGRADLTFGPNASAAYKAAKDGKTKELGTLNGGWPLTAEIAFTTQKGNGLAVAAQAALNQLIEDGDYAKILDRWGALFGGHPEVRAEPGRPAQEVGAPADERIPALQQRCGDPPLTTCGGVSTLSQLSLAVDRGGSNGRQFQKQHRLRISDRLARDRDPARGDGDSG